MDIPHLCFHTHAQAYVTWRTCNWPEYPREYPGKPWAHTLSSFPLTPANLQPQGPISVWSWNNKLHIFESSGIWLERM